MRRITVFHRTGLRIKIKDRVVRHGINKNVNRIKNIDVNCLRIRKEKKKHKLRLEKITALVS